MIRGSFKYKFSRLIGHSSADYRPIIGRLPKPKNCRPMEKKYNKLVIFFLSADEKRAKIWHFIGDKWADCRPTVGGVNVIGLTLILSILNCDFENKNEFDFYFEN